VAAMLAAAAHGLKYGTASPSPFPFPSAACPISKLNRFSFRQMQQLQTNADKPTESVQMKMTDANHR
jgi:hypothetical protein